MIHDIDIVGAGIQSEALPLSRTVKGQIRINSGNERLDGVIAQMYRGIDEMVFALLAARELASVEGAPMTDLAKLARQLVEDVLAAPTTVQADNAVLSAFGEVLAWVEQEARRRAGMLESSGYTLEYLKGGVSAYTALAAWIARQREGKA